MFLWPWAILLSSAQLLGFLLILLFLLLRFFFFLFLKMFGVDETELHHQCGDRRSDSMRPSMPGSQSNNEELGT